MIESGFGNKSVQGSSGTLVLGEAASGTAPAAQLWAGLSGCGSTGSAQPRARARAWPRPRPQARARLALLGHWSGFSSGDWAFSPGGPAAAAQSGSSNGDCVGAQAANLPQFA